MCMMKMIGKGVFKPRTLFSLVIGLTKYNIEYFIDSKGHLVSCTKSTLVDQLCAINVNLQMEHIYIAFGAVQEYQISGLAYLRR